MTQPPYPTCDTKLLLLLSCSFRSDMTCGAARSILPGRASHEVRSSRNNVASCKEGGRGCEARAATPSIQGVGNQDRVVGSTQVKRR